MVLGVVISRTLELILNSIQLALYIILLFLAAYKLTRTILNKLRTFFLHFYFGLLFILGIEIGMQIYQIIQVAVGKNTEVIVVVLINIYAMAAQATVIFLLAYYWRDTEEILKNHSTEMEIQSKANYVIPILMGFWMIIYSGYVIFIGVALDFVMSPLEGDILVFLCQGIAVFFMLWSIILQIVNGNKLSNTIRIFEERLSSVEMHKLQFRCLYWITSLFNTLRIAFLVLVTVTLKVDGDQYIDQSWLAAFIYTGSNIVILLIYILGFSTKTSTIKSSLLDGNSYLQEDRKSESSNRSRHETELSSSSNPD